MPVRKTEGRIPAALAPSDLGQEAVAGDGHCAMVSFIASPLAVDRENTYVVLVTEAALAAQVNSYEWTFTQEGVSPSVQSTDIGQISFTPTSIGALNVSVRILDGGNAEQARLELAQDVVPLNAILEASIVNAANEPGPGLSNPEVAREVVNDHNPYYQQVALQPPESDDAFKRFVFSMVFDGVLARPAARRKEHVDQLAASINEGDGDFVTLTAEGAGVCRIRLTMLAMVTGNPAPLLPWTELPEPADKRGVADEQLRQTLAALDENARIDLFNLARFPKSNITQCGRIIETLRNHYFNGANFNDVLTGMSGTRAHWITRHYLEGPLVPS
jgi:hypothetical protein